MCVCVDVHRRSKFTEGGEEEREREGEREKGGRRKERKEEGGSFILVLRWL